jgi:glutathione S-transferase
MLKLYSFQGSGNCYKVRLLLAQLGIPFRVIETDILAGGARTPEYLAKNPNGRTPMVVFGNGNVLCESGAILHHFALGTRYLPENPLMRSRTLQWMFFEQNNHEPTIAVARHWLKYRKVTTDHRERMEALHEGGYRVFGVMEQHLSEMNYFPGDTYSIADIALYAYSHVAHEGGFDLTGYPNIRAWLGRVSSQPGHITMDHICR